MSPALLQGEKVRQRHPTCLVNDSSLGSALLSLTTASQTGFLLVPCTPVSEGNPTHGRGFPALGPGTSIPYSAFPSIFSLELEANCRVPSFSAMGYIPRLRFSPTP